MRGLVLVQGAERRGKTFSSKAWCNLHPGVARYVKTPSTSDDIGFFREIAKSLGIGCGQSLKTVQLRECIEDVLSGRDLMLVFDNAHNLFRQSMYRNAIPHRLTWILTALVDEGIPVAFVATPQFSISQQLTVERSKWQDGQLAGRIKHFERLGRRPWTVSNHACRSYSSRNQAAGRVWSFIDRSVSGRHASRSIDCEPPPPHKESLNPPPLFWGVGSGQFPVSELEKDSVSRTGQQNKPAQLSVSSADRWRGKKSPKKVEGQTRNPMPVAGAQGDSLPGG